MEFRRQVVRMLYDDHQRTRTALERFAGFLNRAGPTPPGPELAETRQAASEISFLLDQEIGTHFTFEEEDVFPYLAERGDAPICALLLEEHETIRSAARRIVERLRSPNGPWATPASWASFSREGLDLAAALSEHSEKEDHGLLPALDDFLDEETDARLAMEFAARR